MKLSHRLLAPAFLFSFLLLLSGTAQETPAASPHPIIERMKALEKQRDADFARGGTKLANEGTLAAAEELIRAYPDRSEPYDLLLEAAFESEDGEARTLFTRIEQAPVASARAKKMSALQLKRLALVGQPLQLKFTTLDGKAFDMADHRGQVVVIDWWATWCGPCMEEFPHFKEVVSRFSSHGVVFVGISLDQKREKLDAFISTSGVAWPQYFDGKGWSNELSVNYNVRSIPAVWLIDRHGVLRDTYGRGDLEKKLERLLAE
jgi:thiol-disulfide isomerase/thioredoxin